MKSRDPASHTRPNPSYSAMMCKPAIILLLLLPGISLPCSSQGSGLIGLIEFTPRAARLLRSQAGESDRRDGAEHWQGEMLVCSAAITTLIFAKKAWQQTASGDSLQTWQITASASCSPAAPRLSLCTNKVHVEGRMGKRGKFRSLQMVTPPVSLWLGCSKRKTVLRR